MSTHYVCFRTDFLITEGEKGMCKGGRCPDMIYDTSEETCCGGVVYRKDLDENNNPLSECCKYRNIRICDLSKILLACRYFTIQPYMI